MYKEGYGFEMIVSDLNIGLKTGWNSLLVKQEESIDGLMEIYTVSVSLGDSPNAKWILSPDY